MLRAAHRKTDATYALVWHIQGTQQRLGSLGDVLRLVGEA